MARKGLPTDSRIVPRRGEYFRNLWLPVGTFSMTVAGDVFRPREAYGKIGG